MRSHVPLSALADHLSKVKPLERASLEHLERCPYCASDLQWLQALGSYRQWEPPKSALETALKYFKKKDAA